jgi:hypothetical protein
MQSFSTRIKEKFMTNTAWKVSREAVAAVAAWTIFSVCSWEVEAAEVLLKSRGKELSHKLNRSMSAWQMCTTERQLQSMLIDKESVVLAMVLEELMQPPFKPVQPVKVRE